MKTKLNENVQPVGRARKQVTEVRRGRRENRFLALKNICNRFQAQENVQKVSSAGKQENSAKREFSFSPD